LLALRMRGVRPTLTALLAAAAAERIRAGELPVDRPPFDLGPDAHHPSCSAAASLSCGRPGGDTSPSGTVSPLLEDPLPAAQPPKHSPSRSAVAPPALPPQPACQMRNRAH